MEYLLNDCPKWDDVDIEKVCRICLQPDDELLLIFDELNSYNQISLAQMIKECSNCSVERHDDYPHQICLKCVEVLKIAYTFRLKCKKSHKIAELVLNNGKESRIPIIDIDQLPPQDKFTQTEALAFFPCEKCDEKFMTIEKLRTHRYYIHKGTSHECRVCNKSFRRISYLKNHLAFFHPELGFINHNECDICSKKFGRPEHLRRHLLKIHQKPMECKTGTDEFPKNKSLNNDPIRKYDCNLCLTEFENDNDLKKHTCTKNIDLSMTNDDIKNEVEESHFENDILEDMTAFDLESDDEDVKPLSILKEEYQFEKYDNINTTTTVKEKPENEKVQIINATPKKIKTEHNCSTCNKSFSRRDHLARHERVHLNIKPFNCLYCNKSFSRSDNLNHHLTNSHSEEQPFKCEKCNKGFPRRDNLVKHQNICLNGKENPKLERPKPYVCEICKKSFTTKRHHKVHVNSHSTKTFSCKFCQMVHTTKEESVEHLKTHDNQKPYLCSECGLRFVRNDYLIIHMRRHNGEKPYKCKFCNKGFPRATDLTVHERYHTGEKSHLCTTCGKGFHRAYNLVVHNRVHSGERPYKCTFCTKSFAQGNDLKAHIRRHTGERFRCDICNEGFIQGYHLTQHKKVAHGIDQPSHIRRLEKIKPIQQEQQKIEKSIDDVIQSNEIKDDLSNCENTNDEKTNYENDTVAFLNTGKGSNISTPIFYSATNLCDVAQVKYESEFD